MVPRNDITDPASAAPPAAAPPASPPPDPVTEAYDRLIFALGQAFVANAGSDPAKADRATRYLAATRTHRDRWVAGDASATRTMKAKGGPA